MLENSACTKVLTNTSAVHMPRSMMRIRHATKRSKHTSYTWNQENHWKSCFFNRVFKWNCIWVTSEKIESGWGTGLQSVLNRPTKRLEPTSRPRSSRNDWCVCRDQLVHIRLPAPAPEKSGVLAAIFFFSTFAPPNWVHFWKQLQKPRLSVFEPTWRKHDLYWFKNYSFYF